MTERFDELIPELGRGTPLEQAVIRLRDANRCDLIGAAGSAFCRLLAQAHRPGEHAVIVTEDGREALRWARNLTYHLGALGQQDRAGRVLQFPAYDMGPYDELTPDRRATLARAAALFELVWSADWQFIVLPAHALQRKLMPKRQFADACLPLTVGETIDRDLLIAALDRARFLRTPLVEEPGTFAVRGELVDLYPPQMDRPARIELFGDHLERIRLFDPTTQRTEADVHEIWIHPTRPGLLPAGQPEAQEAAGRMRSICDAIDLPTKKTEQLIEDVLQGQLIVGAEGFLPALHAPLDTLFDYLPEDTVFCLTNPAGIRRTWNRYETTLSADFSRQQDQGLPAFELADHLLSSDETSARVLDHRLILSHPFAITDPALHPLERCSDPIDLNGTATAQLGERLRHLAPLTDTAEGLNRLARYLNALSESGYHTIIVAHTSGQAERLTSLLRGRQVDVGLPKTRESQSTRPGITVAEGELVDGCLLPADGRCWIAEEELFGRRQRYRRTSARRGSSLDDLRSLQPRDYVVHVEHGIGRYEGLVRQLVNHVEMDFLLISYRGGDKLYLPVYRINQIQKYKGGQGTESLDRLGGQTFAKKKAQVKQATVRLAGQLLALYARREAASRPPPNAPDDDYHTFEAAFPFEETDDQERAISEVMADLDADRPMDRLVCGDVGFGKTEVALRAAFRVVMSGRQVAVLVPTTVLAQQHYQTFKERFAPYPVRVEMLSRFKSKADNQQTALGLKTGVVDVVVGTHRLLSKDIHFRRFGLLVIDEEHRFGVVHKERIRSLRSAVDTLVLTATPIPRTLHMAIGGIRDLSLITSAPADRRPIRTVICHDNGDLMREAIERELAREGKVFFVHNRVRDIEKIAARIHKLVPQARIVVGHGQMKEETLERVMLDFVAGHYNVLVCTTIIESGLDIASANTILINRADTLGLAQLYQLRGRVGRSHHQAHAYLIVPPLSALSDDARRRVETMARYTDLGSGFSISTIDMEIRGAGDLLGAQQSGSVSAVGLEMYCELLADAVAELRGESRTDNIEPELTFDQPGFIPEIYIPDVGQRLQTYKRLSAAHDEQEVEGIAAELIDRYGKLPEETEQLLKVMTAKTLCRQLRILGLESAAQRMKIHLGYNSRVDPDTVMEIVRQANGRVLLTEELQIKARFASAGTSGIDNVIRFLHRLGAYDNNRSIS